jgi:aminoglycoside phosphotransferase (APT) family kinase protein
MIGDSADAIIQAIVSEQFHDRLLSLRQITGSGSVNLVYVVTLTNRKLVIRTNDKPTASAEFAKEKFCAAVAREHDVRTPAIHFVGSSNGIEYSIQSYVDGRSGKFDAQSQSAIFEWLGRTAQILHCIPVAGFGERYDEQHNSFIDSFERYLHYNIGQLTNADPFIGLGVYTIENQRQIHETLAKLENTRFRRGLVHGDMAPRNVICEPEGAFSLIDWGSAEANVVPHLEFVELLKHHKLDSSPIQSFCRGYGLSEMGLQRLLPEIRALGMLRALDKLRWAIDKGPERISEYAAKAAAAVRDAMHR